MHFPKATEMAHELASKRLRKKSVAIDATCGNGHDTLFLAQKVGIDGRVFALDIQDEAILASRERLQEELSLGPVRFFRSCHSQLLDVIPKSYRGRARVVMFNLGYLPGSDKSLTTSWPTTLAGIRAALQLISNSGIITVTVYPGHPAGQEEANALGRFVQTLDPDEYRVLEYRFLNLSNNPPYLLAIERTGKR